MLIRNLDFQKTVIGLSILAVAAAFIILPDFGPLVLLPEILVFIVFLEVVCAVQPAPRQPVCAACPLEVLPRSPPAF